MDKKHRRMVSGLVGLLLFLMVFYLFCTIADTVLLAGANMQMSAGAEATIFAASSRVLYPMGFLAALVSGLAAAFITNIILKGRNHK